ncbi:MAG: S41 family peptidase [Syntrophobacteraceae bacterium]
MTYVRLFKTMSVAAFAVLLTALAGGSIPNRAAYAGLDKPAAQEPDFKLIDEAWNIISKEYVEHNTVQREKLTYGAITGMVNALGDTGHSTFLTPDMVPLAKNFIEGSFTGVGIEVRMKEGRVVIVAPLEDSPAQRAGLQSGDVIVKVDEKDVLGLPLDEVIKRIMGRPGTVVSLTILSPKTGQTRTVSLVRAAITIHNVTWSRLPHSQLADLHIAGFSAGVTHELRKALKEIKKQRLNGAILDLRDNPGGVFEASVSSTSQFLNGGTVVLVKNNRGVINRVPVQPGGLTPDIKLVVLINGGTASAAEIMAGALQDAHRAALVGEKTFGTGTVLEQFKLSNGSALLLAIAEWLTPDGRVIWHKGIMPDVEVPLPADVEPLFPERIKDLTMAQIQASGDSQLLRALALIAEQGKGERQ